MILYSPEKNDPALKHAERELRVAWQMFDQAKKACIGRLIAVGGLCVLVGLIIGRFVFDRLIYYLTYPMPFDVWFPLTIGVCLIVARILSRPTSPPTKGGQS